MISSGPYRFLSNRTGSWTHIYPPFFSFLVSSYCPLRLCLPSIELYLFAESDYLVILASMIQTSSLNTTSTHTIIPQWISNTSNEMIDFEIEKETIRQIYWETGRLKTNGFQLGIFLIHYIWRSGRVNYGWSVYTIRFCWCLLLRLFFYFSSIRRRGCGGTEIIICFNAPNTMRCLTAPCFSDKRQPSRLSEFLFPTPNLCVPFWRQKQPQSES